jgi:hypothetical protein
MQRYTGKSKIRALTLPLALIFLLGGCHVTEIRLSETQTGSQQSTERGEPSEAYQYASVGFGIYDLTKETHESCSVNPKAVLIETDLVNTVLHFIIGGIYTRRNIMVYCN